MNSVGNTASIWTLYTYYNASEPHYRPALGACIGLQVLGLIYAQILRWYLAKQNCDLAMLEQEDAQLTKEEVRRLEKTAEVEEINIAAAGKLRKGYRYMI